MGILADAARVPDVDRLAAKFGAAFRDYRAAATREAGARRAPAT